MALPASGVISIGNLRTEFSGPTPSALSNYYRGGAYVPNTPTNASVPTSGVISLSNFYNASSQVGFIGMLVGGTFNTGSQLNGIGFDSSGNVYSYGGGGTGNALAKYNSNGSLQFQKSISLGTNLECVQIKVDSSGNTYGAGSYTSGGSTFPHIVKYDSSGNLSWGYTLSATGLTGNFFGCELDSSNNLHAVGSVNITGVTSGTAMVVAKINSSGALQWIRNIDIPAQGTGDFARGVGVDSSGNVYVTGSLNVSIPPSYTRIFVAKFNSSGTLQWQRTLQTSTTTFNTPYDITADTSGNSYATYIDNSGIPGITKFDTNGNISWQRTIGSGSFIANQIGKSVVVDTTNGFVYVKLNNGFSIVIFKLNVSNGTAVWVREIAASPNIGLVPTGIALSTDLNSYSVVASNLSGLNPGLSSFKFPTDGTKTGTFTITGSNTIIYSVSSFTSTAATLSLLTSSATVTSPSISLAAANPTVITGTSTSYVTPV